MMESPVIQDLERRVRRKTLTQAVTDVLRRRFSDVPSEVLAVLQGITDDEKLRELNWVAGQCADLEAFRAKVGS